MLKAAIGVMERFSIESEVDMKIRQAKKIMKPSFRNGKIGYWHSRYDLYCMGFDGCRDHRITKAEKITARYSRKLMNCLTRWAGKTPFEIRDILSSANKLKRYDL